VIVGRTMIERTSDPASHEKPVRKPGMLKTMAYERHRDRDLVGNVSDSQGTRTVMPSQPHTTLGIPTRSPEPAWTTDLASSAPLPRGTNATPTDSGRRDQAAPGRDDQSPRMNGRIPNSACPRGGSRSSRRWRRSAGHLDEELDGLGQKDERKKQRNDGDHRGCRPGTPPVVANRCVPSGPLGAQPGRFKCVCQLSHRRCLKARYQRK